MLNLRLTASVWQPIVDDIVRTGLALAKDECAGQRDTKNISIIAAKGARHAHKPFKKHRDIEWSDLQGRVGGNLHHRNALVSWTLGPRIPQRFDQEIDDIVSYSHIARV